MKNNTKVLKKSNLKHCPHPVGIHTGYIPAENKVVTSKIACGSWSCPYCGKKKRKTLYNRMRNGNLISDNISKYGLKFATLTFGGEQDRKPFRVREKKYDKWGDCYCGDYLTQQVWNSKKKAFRTAYVYDVVKMYEIMSEKFSMLIEALRIHYPGFHYFRICENHVDGVPHFHVLFAGNSIIPKGFLDRVTLLWRHKYSLGFVKVNNVKFSDANHAINYLLKYLTKDIKSVGKYKRIFSASKGSLQKKGQKQWVNSTVIYGRTYPGGHREYTLDEHLDTIEMDGTRLYAVPDDDTLFVDNPCSRYVHEGAFAMEVMKEHLYLEYVDIDTINDI